MFSQILTNLVDLYRNDSRPWLVGFSGGKDSTMVAALVFSAVLSVPSERRTKPITVISTDTRVEIPAIAETLESALKRMQRFSKKTGLNIETVLSTAAGASILGEFDRARLSASQPEFSVVHAANEDRPCHGFRQPAIGPLGRGRSALGGETSRECGRA